MGSRTILKLVSALAFFGLALPIFLADAPVSARPSFDATPIGDDLRDPKYLNKNACPDDPKNLVTNGGFYGDTHDTTYGPVVNGWDPFIVSGTPPQFRWVNNEGIFKSQSEQILSTNTFDAGILQTVRNLQPNAYYWFRLGWAPAAKSTSGPNDPSSSVGVQVGFDPFGGTDPNSANVTWGMARFNDNKNLNRPEFTLVFPARATSVTMFLRAIAKDASGGENRVWFNAVCMEARPELGTATPLPATPTTVPSATPTRPPPPPRPGATRIAQAPPATDTPVPATATTTNTPTPRSSPTSSATPRYARPDVTPTPSLPVDPGTGAMTGLGVGFIFIGFTSLGTGVLLWMKQTQSERPFQPKPKTPVMWQ